MDGMKDEYAALGRLASCVILGLITFSIAKYGSIEIAIGWTVYFIAQQTNRIMDANRGNDKSHD